MGAEHVAGIENNVGGHLARDGGHCLLRALGAGTGQSCKIPHCGYYARTFRFLDANSHSLSLQALHAGVERDEERQRIKRQRQAEFEMQRKLEEEYRKIQKVSDSGIGGSGQEEKNIGQGT